MKDDRPDGEKQTRDPEAGQSLPGVIRLAADGQLEVGRRRCRLDNVGKGDEELRWWVGEDVEVADGSEEGVELVVGRAGQRQARSEGTLESTTRRQPISLRSKRRRPHR